MLKKALRETLYRLLPARAWTALRNWRNRQFVTSFSPRTVEHTYAGFPLKVHLADPLAEAWYDRDWLDLPELRLLKESRLKPGATVFDCGAHQAVVALILSHIVGPAGTVVAVEANPHNFQSAQVNRELNRAQNLHLVHAAVADKTGTISFNLDFNGQIADGTGKAGEMPIRAVTIDELAQERGPPDVIYIDIEGFECQALAGAAETLRRRPDCFVEVHVGCGLEKFGSLERLLSHFPPEDYRLFACREFATYDRFSEPEPFDPAGPIVEDRFLLIAQSREGERAG